MEKEPLKDLLEIASRDMLLATKIAEKFPVELIDYEVIIKEQSFLNSGKANISRILINKIDPKVFSLKKLLKIRSKIEYTKRKFTDEVIEKIPDDILEVDIIFELLNSKNEEEQSFGIELSIRLPKSNLNLNLLIQSSKSKRRHVSMIAKTLIAKYFICGIDFKTLIEYSEDNDEYIKSEAIRELLTNHQGRITYLDCVRFQSVKDKAARKWARGIAYAEPAPNLNYIKLLDIYSKASDDPEKAVRQLTAELLQKIGPENYNVPTLFNIMKFTDSATTLCISLILLEIAEVKPSILSIDEIMPYFSAERTNVRSTARQMLVDYFPDDKKLTFELLDLFYDEANQKMKQETARVMLRRFPENLGIKMLITFLGLQAEDVTMKALAQINGISPYSIDLFEVIEFAAFSKSSYDLTPIREFVSEYLESLPKEVILKEEKRLLWYSSNGNDRTVKEIVEKLLKSCKTDYNVKVEEFFTRHKIKSA